MNTTQLRKLGVPDDCLTVTIQGIQLASAADDLRGKQMKERIGRVVETPSDYVADPYFGGLAQKMVERAMLTRAEPISFTQWGTDIDGACQSQMRQACSLPMAVGAALMPDAHVGYGIPIGGVLALENAVVPYAVGVDIACRMKLSVLDVPTSGLDDNFHRFKTALMNGTRFGIGSTHETPQDHAVLDQDWHVSRVTREHKDKARKQLGTSGSGNHFVEFGIFTLTEKQPEFDLEPGKYVALLSHSGSRGTGAAVCDTYSNMARARLPKQFADVGRLAWLSLDDEAGQEYWAAMNLMGDYGGVALSGWTISTNISTSQSRIWVPLAML